ncbi:DUF2461 domain-containing protein [Haloflavibacter putidus]|uniref:DUF2461 domain-containing protein n=1 Tax=Haloflavibacter putidus TaxID=2576776 RepID=A0A507ZNE0_9FLAO|nr:DUF2461 domain-containing protein [Haloflavibacter putidus]TQD39050.1 DUF2461 domain-containing protein [Haloflavibacter putidus]
MQQIPASALEFLKQLKKNNNREWFDEHKSRFKEEEQQMKLFYKTVESLLLQHDSIIKTKAYRIYRDVRFSKDKTPYKKHFAASFTRKKPELRGGYYLHIQPGNKSFLGVGFWNPEKDDLYRIRKEIEIDATEMRAILNGKNLQKHWGEIEGKRLKTSPRGFDKNHPDIDLINLKQYIFTHTFTDKEVLTPDFAETVNQHFKAIKPFFDYMSEILTTNLNGESLID